MQASWTGSDSNVRMGRRVTRVPRVFECASEWGVLEWAGEWDWSDPSVQASVQASGEWRVPLVLKWESGWGLDWVCRRVGTGTGVCECSSVQVSGELE